MNSFHFTATVVKFGIRGKQFPEMWLLCQLPLIKNRTQHNDNKLFLNIRLDDGRGSQDLRNNMREGVQVFVLDATVTDIKHSKKREDGEWEEEIKTGVRANAKNVFIKNNRVPELNFGQLRGKVSKHHKQMLIVEEQYRFPTKEGTVKQGTRSIPVMLDQEPATDLAGRHLFLVASLRGIMPDGRQKVYVEAEPIIDLWN